MIVSLCGDHKASKGTPQRQSLMRTGTLWGSITINAAQARQAAAADLLLLWSIMQASAMQILLLWVIPYKTGAVLTGEQHSRMRGAADATLQKGHASCETRQTNELTVVVL